MQKVISISKIIIVVIIFNIYALFIFTYNLFKLKNRKKYLKTILISLDQTGAAIIDGTEDWTISSNSYKKCITKQQCLRKEFIDFAFGKGHCKKSYYNEINDFKKGLKNVK